jgi:hypothetical protein
MQISMRVASSLEMLDIDSLEPLQGELKKLSEVNFNKLRKSILDKGFKLVLHVWRSGGVNYLIDGHQRVYVMQQMRKQGIEVPPVPCAMIEAKNYKEAKETVLMAVSQYGKIDREGFVDFTKDEGFDFDLYDFPDFNVDIVFPELDDNPIPSFDDSDDPDDDNMSHKTDTTQRDTLEKFLSNDMRTMQLGYSTDLYDKVVSMLSSIGESIGVTSNSDVVLHLIEKHLEVSIEEWSM